MGVKIRDDNKIPELKHVLKELGNTSVEVGIFGEDDEHLLMVARVHEFGTHIKVTPKMRAWFAYQGYPLRTETTEINIPERSYMRSGFDENVKELEMAMYKLLVPVIELKLSVKEFYERIGLWMVSRLQSKIVDLDEPPNTQMTIESKGSSNPLIDTGRLNQSITYRVVKGK